jgi:hypothetical protein
MEPTVTSAGSVTLPDEDETVFWLLLDFTTELDDNFATLLLDFCEMLELDFIELLLDLAF